MKPFQKDKENAKEAVAEYKHISRKEDLNEAYYLLHMDYMDMDCLSACKNVRWQNSSQVFHSG